MSNNQFLNQTNPDLEVPRTTFDEIRWEVKFSPENLKYVGDWTRDEIERITNYQSNAMDSVPTSEELQRYFSSLTYCRIKIVRQEKLPNGIKPAFLRRLFIPARFATVLSMVGEVVYPDVAVRIIPQYDVEEKDIMTMDEMTKMAIRLEKYFVDGLCGVLGMSMDRYGDAHFMNKVCIIEGKVQETVKSMTKDNPLYGFMAWLMNAELLEVAFDEARYLMRINYSAPNIYESLGRKVWNGFNPDHKPDRKKNDDDPGNDGTGNVLSDQPDVK